jgi:hypothetical protein
MNASIGSTIIPCFSFKNFRLIGLLVMELKTLAHVSLKWQLSPIREPHVNASLYFLSLCVNPKYSSYGRPIPGNARDSYAR